MKLIARLLCAVMICSTAHAALKSDRTFLAHREEVSNLGMDWVTTHHYHTPHTKRQLGSTLMATPFFAQSTNHEDLAHLFGMGTTKKIAVTKGTRPTRDNLHSALYSFNIDHAPNADGSRDGQIPMSGTATFRPQRHVWGALLSWDQSLSAVMPGLRVSLRAPMMEVSTTMKASFQSAESSAVKTVDGVHGTTIDTYFDGTLSKSLGTTTHVVQEPLRKHKFDNKWHSEIGVGDVVATLSWNALDLQRLHWGVSAMLQVPTGNAPTGEWLFEPIYGARGHFAGGFGTHIHFDGYQSRNSSVSFDLKGEWKYYFKGTENRTLGIYDNTESVMLPASSYRGLVYHEESGVKPAANVMTTEHTVTPGHQVEALAGLSFKMSNITFDIGYNLFIREKEKVEQKANWSSDTYAIAHHRYSMYTSALGQWIIGGNILDNENTHDTTELVQNSGLLGDNEGVGDNYDDTKSPIQKHGNKIGANHDGWKAEHQSRDNGLDGNGGEFPPANVSMNGPIQANGKTTSTLSRRTPASNGVDADASGGDAGTLTVRYNVSSANAVTESQVTHSIVGGIGYKSNSDYPLILGVGGQVELQESNRNSALEGWKVWMKCGVSF